jgi:ribosomal-protein-alanine N-acetyltransferase
MSGESVTLSEGGAADLAAVMRVMENSFDPRYGEAWTAAQCAGLLPMRGVWLILASDERGVVGFGLARLVANEAELLLLAVSRESQCRGVGKKLLDRFEALAKTRGAARFHLEVREGNHAVKLYEESGFCLVGRRRNYYTGQDGCCYDALTLAKAADSRD